jgi:hypothetical protein
MRIQLQFALVAAALICSLIAEPAQAQRAHVFVASFGSDTNPCSFSLPCRTFQQAVNTVATGGEVTVIDTAGYGTIVISRSVTITNPAGVEAGVFASSGDAILINASSSAVVTLRGLTLEGNGVGANGIHLTSTAAGALTIVDTVVKDFTNDGILVANGGGIHTIMNIDIFGTKVLNNGADGIAVAPTSEAAAAEFVIAHSSADQNHIGVHVDASAGNAYGTITDTIAQLNSNDGFQFSGVTYWRVVMRNCLATINGGYDIDNANPATVGLLLFDGNTANGMNNAGTTYSDGTNNLLSVAGNALQAAPRQ